MKTRCDAVVVQVVITEVDEMDRPVGEHVSTPIKVFRAKARDFWAEIDKAVTTFRQQTPPQVPPAVREGRKRR